jgi:hypothetical protein
MLKLLLGRMDETKEENKAWQAKLDAGQEESKAWQKDMKAKMYANTEATLATKEDMEADRKQRKAEMEEMLSKMEERIAAIRAKADVKLEELTKTREEMLQSAEEHHVVPDEDAVEVPVRIRRRRHGGRKETAGRRREPKELTRGDRGSRKKLAAACRKASHRETVAWIKRNVFRKSWTSGHYGLRKEVTVSRKEVTRCERHRLKVAQRSSTGGTFEHRFRRGLQYGMGRKDPTVINNGWWSSRQLSPLERRG